MTVRFLTWNVWWRFGPWEQRQAAIEATLRTEAPDIVCLQEVWASDGGNDQAATLAASLGYEYARTPSPFWEGFSFGNAVLSRWPILAAQTHRLPDEHGLNQRVRLRTKGWLPYTLLWEFVVTESRYPDGFAIEAFGDFVGRGVWTIAQDDDFVNVEFDWRIRAEKPLLQVLAPLLRPLLEANHRWAMGQGEASLNLELARRRAATDAARRSVPPPPGPVTYAAVGILAGAALVGGGLGLLVLRHQSMFCAVVRVSLQRC